MTSFDIFLNALILQAGYNTAIVTLGATLLGFAAGGIGTFIFLRKRSLVSDAIAHACLPGLCIAFLIMVAFGLDGRFLPGLLIGAGITAWVGLLLIQWMVQNTRLSEDASIGAILSVFFGFGIVLLTLIQNVSSGRQAGLETFLLGSTSGMLYSEAVTIAAVAAVSLLFVFAFWRPMIIMAFDSDYAVSTGIDMRRTDLLIMGLALLITVVGLKIVGVVLIVALLIIPAVTARFWTEQAGRLVLLAMGIGGVCGYLGASLSSAMDNLPTGPIIVLLAFACFLFSLLCSPVRGVFASVLSHWTFTKRVHLRQGLLALARGEAIYDGLTLKLLQRSGFIRKDGVPTVEGEHAAQKALHDEARWDVARRLYKTEDILSRYDGLTPIQEVLTPDEIAELDLRLRENVV